MGIELTAAFGTLFEYYPDPTDASIRAMATLAISRGGGRIYIPAGTIALASALPLANNIQYIGIMPSMTKPSDAVIDQSPTIIGGTRLTGNGTFPAFQYNDAVVTSGTVVWNGLTGVVLDGMSLEGFSRGISIGNYNNCGLAYSVIRNIVVADCRADWGIWFNNFQHVEITNVMTTRCAHGQFYGCLVAFGVCAFGNSTITETYTYKPVSADIDIDPYFSRGIVFSAGAYDGSSPSFLNEMVLIRPQVSGRYLSIRSVTATLTNASMSIGVPDSTKFKVGMPVRFTATVGGFEINRSYFVRSIVDATNLTLADTPLGSAIAATASTTGTLTTYGMPDVEVTAENTAGYVANLRMEHLDFEGLPEIGVLFYLTKRSWLSIGEVPSSGATHLVFRSAEVNVQATMSSAAGPTYDADSGSNLSRIDGARGAAYQYSLPGIGRDYGPNVNFPIPFMQMIGSMSRLGGTNMKGSGLAARSVGDWQTRGSGLFNYASMAIGQKVVTYDTSQTLNFSEYIGCVIFNGATGQTFTLPTIVSETNPAASYVGAEYDIVNVSANALTLNTDGTQLFNTVASLVSLSLPAKTVTRVKAVRTAGGTLFWFAEASQALRVS